MRAVSSRGSHRRRSSRHAVGCWGSTRTCLPKSRSAVPLASRKGAIYAGRPSASAIVISFCATSYATLFGRGAPLDSPHPLDLDVLSAEASSLLGTHDFAAFRLSMDTRTETVRTIESVQVETLPRDPRILIIDVVGNAFMHNMVRIIVGSLLDVARGHLPRGTLAKALLGGTRADLGMTAPAHGLCLETIEHSLALEEVWP